MLFGVGGMRKEKKERKSTTSNSTGVSTFIRGGDQHLLVTGQVEATKKVKRKPLRKLTSDE